MTEHQPQDNYYQEPHCGYCTEGWPRFQYNGNNYHTVAGPQDQVPCAGTFLRFPLLAELKVGDKLITDNGFTCLGDRVIVEVKEAKGEFFVECSKGEHFLLGQEDEQGECVGLARYDVAEPRND